MLIGAGIERKVELGVVSALPIPGVDMLLGNEIAGCVVNPAPIMTEIPLEDIPPGQLSQEIEDLLPACVVTRSQKKEALDAVLDLRKLSKE